MDKRPKSVRERFKGASKKEIWGEPGKPSSGPVNKPAPINKVSHSPKW